MPHQRYEPHHKICNSRYGTSGYEMSLRDSDTMESLITTYT